MKDQDRSNDFKSFFSKNYRLYFFERLKVFA